MSRVLVDSGIDWLGKIPKDWNRIKTKYLVSITTGRKDANESSENGQYPFFTCSIENKKINDYSFDTEALLVAGNGIVGYTRYYNGKFDAYQRTYVLNNFNEKVNPTYLKYYFNSLLSKKLEVDKVGSVIDFIKLGDLKNFIITFPILDEQKKIANYLNKKCSKIDEIIKDNNKEIKLLEEYKLNIIDDNINNLLKKSKTVKLKYLGNFINGISAGANKFNHGNCVFINYGDVYNNFVVPEIPLGRIDLTDKEKNIYSLKKGDILFTRTSETIDEVGISSVCLKDYPSSAFSGFVIRFRNMSKYIMNPNFYKYYFKSRKLRDYFASNMNLVTRASLSQNLLGILPIVIPDESNQVEIANRLDGLFSKINNVIEYRKQIIEKLEEYKKSLIYECVTGKREV